MFVKIKQDKLLKALKLIKAINIQDQYVCFETKKTLTISARNIDKEIIKIKLDCEIWKSGKITVIKFEWLLYIVENFDANSELVLMKQDDKLLISSNGAKGEIPALIKFKKYKMKKYNFENNLNLLPEMFNDLGKYKFIINPNSNQDFMKYFQLEIKKEQSAIKATDGCQVFQKLYKIENKLEIDLALTYNISNVLKEIEIENISLEYVILSTNTKQAIRLTINDNIMLFFEHHLVKFANFGQVLMDKFNFIATFNREQLIQSLNFITTFETTNVDYVLFDYVLFDYIEKQCIIYNDSNHHIISKVIPVNYEQFQNAKMAYNKKFLLDFLNTLTAETVTFKTNYTELNRLQCLFINDENITFGLMPARC